MTSQGEPRYTASMAESSESGGESDRESHSSATESESESLGSEEGGENIEPYQYEPVASQNSDEASKSDEEGEDERLQNMDW